VGSLTLKAEYVYQAELRDAIWSVQTARACDIGTFALCPSPRVPSLVAGADGRPSPTRLRRRVSKPMSNHRAAHASPTLDLTPANFVDSEPESVGYHALSPSCRCPTAKEPGSVLAVVGVRLGLWQRWRVPLLLVLQYFGAILLA
jgi:hypothetical protein